MKKRKPKKTQESYTQCALHLLDGPPGSYDLRWIPTKFAVKGKIIREKKTNKQWKVIYLYATWNEDDVLEIEESRKRMVETTDMCRDPITGYYRPVGSKK